MGKGQKEIRFKLDPKKHQEIKDEAEKQGLIPSSFVRSVVYKELAQLNQKSN